jgi:type IV fimbrial biogenesis protein FimT
LLELLTAVAVLAVLLTIGVPSFVETIRNNRTAVQTNALVSALNLALSEASKGFPVAVCAADAARTGCAGDDESDWGNGWLVFRDATGTAGVIDEDDAILQTSDPVHDDIRVTSNDLGFIRFGPKGRPTSAAATPIGTAVITFGVQHEHCSGTNRRVISVDRTGRVNLTKVACES